MSDPSPLLLAAFAFMLVLAALRLLLRGGADRLMLGRAESLGLGRGRAPPQAEAGPSIRMAAPDERPLGRRVLGLLGYNPEIPPRHAMSWRATTAIGIAIGVVAAWQLHGRLGILPAALVGAAVALGAMRLLFRRAADRYADLLFAQIPDAVSLVLRAVRAGLPVSEAIRSIAQETPSPTSIEFGRVAQETSIGIPVETAIWNLYRRCGVKEYAFLSVTIGLQAQTGGNLAETLGNLADLVRRRVAMAGKVRAISAEGRASASILVALPFIVGAVLAVMSPDYVAELFTHARSPGFLLAFVVLMTTGILTIRWMIQRSTTD